MWFDRGMTSSQHSEPRTCNCGCTTPLTGKGNYKPGHDAKHVSYLLVSVRIELEHLGHAVKATEDGLKALPSHALKTKFLRAIDRMEARASKKA